MIDFRFFYFNAHYSKQQNFTYDSLKSARNARINFIKAINEHKNGDSQLSENKLENYKDEEIKVEAKNLIPNSFALSIVEGWRGELVHIATTDETGKLTRYKIKDPSFNNWYGLSMAVRGNGISDFPLCNKGFDLSYCGFDL